MTWICACAICLEASLLLPCTLPCGHTFDSHCLLRVIAREALAAATGDDDSDGDDDDASSGHSDEEDSEEEDSASTRGSVASVDDDERLFGGREDAKRRVRGARCPLCRRRFGLRDVDERGVRDLLASKKKKKKTNNNNKSSSGPDHPLRDPAVRAAVESAVRDLDAALAEPGGSSKDAESSQQRGPFFGCRWFGTVAVAALAACSSAAHIVYPKEAAVATALAHSRAFVALDAAAGTSSSTPDKKRHLENASSSSSSSSSGKKNSGHGEASTPGAPREKETVRDDREPDTQGGVERNGHAEKMIIPSTFTFKEVVDNSDDDPFGGGDPSNKNYHRRDGRDCKDARRRAGDDEATYCADHRDHGYGDSSPNDADKSKAATPALVSHKVPSPHHIPPPTGVKVLPPSRCFADRVAAARN